MNALDRLIELFEKFPGVGGRQARRFAFRVLTLTSEERVALADLIRDLRNEVTECSSCRRFFAVNGSGSTLCSICGSMTRDHTKLLVIERDSDILPIERSGVYDGLYFVLGGTAPLLESEDTGKLRGGGLRRTIEERLGSGLTEVILGFSLNPDGENTSRFVESIIREIPGGTNLTISHLGRGLSTGSEIEYADPETIKNALKNRY